MKSVTVSVLMAAYNARETIDEAIRSVVAQSLEDWELIVIDDASRDGTGNIAAQWSERDDRIRLIALQQNQGPGAARSRGLDEAAGEWITVLDADDRYLRDRLERLLEFAIQERCTVAADNLAIISRKGEVQPGMAFTPAQIEQAAPLTIEALLLCDMPRNGLTSFGYLKPLIKREFIQEHKLRYDASLRVAEDFLFYEQLLLHGARFCMAPWSGYQYRRTDRSLTRSSERFTDNLKCALYANDQIAALSSRLGLLRHQKWLIRHRRRILTILYLDRLKMLWQERQVLALLPAFLRLFSYPMTLSRLILDRMDGRYYINPLVGEKVAIPDSDTRIGS